MDRRRRRQGILMLLAGTLIAVVAAGYLRGGRTDAGAMTGQRLLLQSAAFSSPFVGWLVLRNPTDAASSVVKTEDGGLHWRLLSVPLTSKFGGVGLQVIDSSSVLLQMRGRIAITVDGGNTWRESALPHTLPIAMSLDFTDPMRGWYLAGGAGQGLARPAALWSTHDGGERWSLLWSVQVGRNMNGIPLDGDKRLLGFDTAAEGWLAVIGLGSTQLLVTRDGGASWTPVATMSDGQPISVKRFAPRDLVVTLRLPAGYALLRSTDDGASWDRTAALMPPASDFDLPSVPTVMASALWIESSGNRVALTKDGGTTWRTFDAALPRDLVLETVIWMWDTSRGYAIARDGFENPYIVATIDGGHRWTDATAPQIAIGSRMN